MGEASARLYIAGWSVACLAALVFALLERRRITLLSRSYWQMLLQPWKLASFLVAAVALTAVAPYSGDPTWDHNDAAFMAVATFATAPWAVGTLWRAVRGRVAWRQVPVAACLWLASASWSYDLYIYRRDGRYPPTWASNLLASSVLYVAAGLLWSLEWRSGRGVTFGFLEEAWPRAPEGAQWSRLAWLALAIMVLVALGFLPFFEGLFRK